MKKNFGHYEDMRNMVYGRFVHFKGGSTLWGDLTPGKDNDIPRMGFRLNKYEFYLDMLDTPRIWGYGVLLDVKDVVYEIGDRACLCVSPLRRVKRFGVKGKLAPRFVGPYWVLECMGEVAYKLELPEGL